MDKKFDIFWEFVNIFGVICFSFFCLLIFPQLLKTSQFPNGIKLLCSFGIVWFAIIIFAFTLKQFKKEIKND